MEKEPGAFDTKVSISFFLLRFISESHELDAQAFPRCIMLAVT